MENLDHEIPQEMTENPEAHSLWLTDRLLAQLRSSSGLGIPFMILCIIVGISSVLLKLFHLWSTEQWSTGDFYLLEDGNLFKIVNILASAVIIYCFARGVLEGHKAWRYLKSSETDDDALLEGTERLAKMFRWLALWGGFFIASVVLESVWRGQI